MIPVQLDSIVFGPIAPNRGSYLVFETGVIPNPTRNSGGQQTWFIVSLHAHESSRLKPNGLKRTEMKKTIAAEEHQPVPAEHLLGAVPRSLLEAAVDVDDGAVGLERVGDNQPARPGRAQHPFNREREHPAAGSIPCTRPGESRLLLLLAGAVRLAVPLHRPKTNPSSGSGLPSAARSAHGCHARGAWRGGLGFRGLARDWIGRGGGFALGLEGSSCPGEEEDANEWTGALPGNRLARTVQCN
jgi:hypothetical protein